MENKSSSFEALVLTFLKKYPDAANKIALSFNENSVQKSFGNKVFNN